MYVGLEPMGVWLCMCVCASEFKVNWSHGTVVKNLPANAGDVPYAEFNPWVGKIP